MIKAFSTSCVYVTSYYRPVYQSAWDPKVDPVVGINKQYLTSLDDVIEHVEDLVFIILGIDFVV